MSVGDLRKLEEFAQSRLPAPHDTFHLANAAPKKELFSDSRRYFQRCPNKVRQDCVDRDASLLGVEKKPITFDPIYTEADRVTDPHPAVTK
ncbi:MAG: hypothetical protein WBC67_02050 [Candidatus Acidiferrales bacterium]